MPIPMPHLGVSVTEGTVIAWHKAAGDTVEADELVCEISTDKVDTEVLAPAAGVIARLVAAEGETVAVGEPLAELAPSSEAAALTPADPAPAAEADRDPAAALAEPAAALAEPAAALAAPLTRRRQRPCRAGPRRRSRRSSTRWSPPRPCCPPERATEPRLLAGCPPRGERARHRPRRRERQRDPWPHP